MVGGRVVQGQGDFLLETAKFAYAIDIIPVVILIEGQEVVVIHLDDSQHHRVEADGVEIDGSVADFWHEHAFLRPTHLRFQVGQVEGEDPFVVEGTAFAVLDAGADRQHHILEVVVGITGFVKVKHDLVANDLRPVSHLRFHLQVALDVTYLKRLREEERGRGVFLIHVDIDGLEFILGDDIQVT